MKKLLFILSALFLYTQSAYATLSDVREAFLKGDYPAAQKMAQMEANSADKNTSSELKYYLALSHFYLAQYDDAQKILEKLSSKMLDSDLKDRVALALFDVYFTQEEYTKAFNVIKKLSRTQSKSDFQSLIYLKLARASLKLSNWRQARDYLLKIINEHPKSMEYHFARQLLEEKQYFSVQVGAFLESSRAEELVNELKDKHEYAYIVETLDEQSRKFYRVRVGQIALLNEAQKLKAKLSEQGYPARIYP